MKRLTLIAMLVTAGCTTVPPTNIHQPMTARPAQRYAAPVGNGAIFQAGYSKPLFEDRRARFVGDTITISITESTTASAKNSNKLDRSGSQKASVASIQGLPGKGLLGLNLDGSSSTNFSGKGEAANNNAFTGSITVTVTDVMPNGNLLVSGEKQLSIGEEQEFVRISGVVNPSFISFANTIDSSRVADARIEYKSAGQISEGQIMGWMARFFLNVLPF
jgi:flagellar L-ring protein precursor FlgH